MRVHLVNPSHISFGVAVITPRWLFVLAGATPATWGDPVLCDETLEPFDFSVVSPGDVVGIGIHTGNALRGYEVGRAARERGAHVVFGGIHATLYPDEAHELGGAHAVVKGDGDIDLGQGRPGLRRRHATARLRGGTHRRLRSSSPRDGTCCPSGRYMWAIGADRARLPEALLVLLRLAHRRPEAAAARRPTPSSARSSSCGAAASVSSRWPTTTSIPCTLADLAQAGGARIPTRLARHSKRSARERFELMDGWPSCPTTWCSSRRSRWKPPRIRSS